MTVVNPAAPDVLALGFKEAMRKQAASIAIITAREDDTWFGMAATAVTSVSTDPPSLLIAVNRSASLHSPVTATRRFCVNLLDAKHDALVRIFSGALKGPERFGHGLWREGHGGLPYLDGAAASVFCDLDAQYDHATHTLFIGSVREVLTDPANDPLIWVNGKSARVESAARP